jgi:hypothetical protein
MELIMRDPADIGIISVICEFRGSDVGVWKVPDTFIYEIISGNFL